MNFQKYQAEEEGYSFGFWLPIDVCLQIFLLLEQCNMYVRDEDLFLYEISTDTAIYGPDPASQQLVGILSPISME